MRVIGTAGHVDHGKSTLIAALTGTHPDRLKEEQAREMTIELGFGWMTLPNGEEVGIVDVPGHRDFIGNMLSGVGGIDAALLVIAADEGVMPQTREHLSILDLLQIPAGLIVLTKTDLVSDITPEGDSGWLDLVETDIRSAVAHTVMQDAPIVRVSAKARTGLQELIAAIQALLEKQSARLDLNRPRLPIDRVFTMSGFGTVVTGTLLDGQFHVGDEVEIIPSGRSGRVRGLQTHNQKQQVAMPGSRTAINISGVDADAVQRGEVIARPGQYQPTRRLDARFRLLKEASATLEHNSEVKFFTGASESIAVVRLLGAEELRPGGEAWIQLELRHPTAAVRGDRFILRRPSPSETLGGGAIVDHQPKGRHKRFDEDVLRSLESLSHGSPSEILLEAALAANAAPIKEIITRSRLDLDAARSALDELLAAGTLLPLEVGASDALVIALSHWNSLREKVLQTVNDYHRTFPLRSGMPREELKSRLKLPPRIFNAATKKLTSDGLLAERQSLIAGAGHEIRFNGQEQANVREWMRKFDENPFSPPGVRECRAGLGEEVLNALIEMGEFVLVSPEVIFRKRDYDSMAAAVRSTIVRNGQITLAETRDLFNTSRKYAQALLEYLDTGGVTIRDGDFRRLKHP